MSYVLLCHDETLWNTNFEPPEDSNLQMHHQWFQSQTRCRLRSSSAIDVRYLSNLPGRETLWKDVYNAIRPADEVWRRTQSLLLGKENAADVSCKLILATFAAASVLRGPCGAMAERRAEECATFQHERGDRYKILSDGREVVLALIRAGVEMLDKHQQGQEDNVSPHCNCIVL